MVFVSVVPKPPTPPAQEILDLGRENEPLLVGDTLYPPDARENPELVLEAIEQNKTIGLKYKPLKVRQDILLNYLIDSFIPDDQPEKLIEFVERMKVCRPELAVKLLERILPAQETAAKTNTNVQINTQGPAPVILVRTAGEKYPELEQTQTNPEVLDALPSD
jgi:hypothetical protein